MRYNELEYIKYKNVKISNIDYRNVYNVVLTTLELKKTGYICLTDVSNLILASMNEQLQVAINGSLLSLADGTPLTWYGWMVGCKEIERISGAYLLKRFFIDMKDCTHFLLGDTVETIDKVIAEARRLNPDINIRGYSPRFKIFDEEDNRQMLGIIRKADPDIVWVSFGGGKQEKWMNQNISALDRGVMIGVGAALRFFIGEIVTPPLIFQRMGLQWLFRLTQQFIKDPGNWFNFVRERKIFITKVAFVMHLPREVKAARQRLKAEQIVRRQKK